MEKKDVETAKTQFQNMLVNSELSVIAYKATIKAFDEELTKFPIEENKDLMPQEVKDLAKEMTK